MEDELPEYMIYKENDCCLWKPNLEIYNPSKNLQKKKIKVLSKYSKNFTSHHF